MFSVGEGFTEVIRYRIKWGLHGGEQISFEESYVRLSCKPPTNLKFYASIFKTLGSLCCREWSRRMSLARKHLLSSLCVKSIVLEGMEIQRWTQSSSCPEDASDLLHALNILWICPTTMECVRLLPPLASLPLEQGKWAFIFSLRQKLPISPSLLIQLLIIQASLLKGKHLFTGSANTE